MLIHLRRIYTFWLFHSNIIELLYTFGNFLYYFLGLTYWSSAQCQFLFVACFCFVENPYQTESKWNKNWWILSHREGLIHLHRIYNFWLFHANILQLLYTLAIFYIIFGTNRLIQCPVPVPVCCLFLFRRISIPNEVQTE